MLFDKLFRREKISQVNNKDIGIAEPKIPETVIEKDKQEKKPSSKRKGSRNPYNVLVLWWISKKKKGYDKTTNKSPKWFMNEYKIDFNSVMEDYLQKGLLEEDNNIVKITAKGEDKLKEVDYVVYIHNHSRYDLSINDFKKSPNLHKVKNEDITWGVFNSRIIEYTSKAMWTSLRTNYANMADLLITEEKFNDALDYIFVVAYLETSGMRDENELTAIMQDYGKKRIVNKYLPNGMPDIFLLEISSAFVTIPFKAVQAKLNLSWEEVKRRFVNSPLVQMMETTLPFKYFEKEESFEIFKQAVEADRKGIFKLAECRDKLKWNIPDENSNTYFYSSIKNKVKQLTSNQ